MCVEKEFVPKSYRFSVDCCAVCKSVMSIGHYDDPTEYYCCFDGTRPSYPELELPRTDENDDAFEKQWEAWEAWDFRKRVVSGKGICDEFERCENGL